MRTYAATGGFNLSRRFEGREVGETQGGRLFKKSLLSSLTILLHESCFVRIEIESIAEYRDDAIGVGQ